MTLIKRAEAYRDLLEKRALTIRELARILGCNECYLSRLFSPTLERVESSTKARKKASRLFEGRQEMRKKHAILVKSGQKSLKKGAADAKCSERTLRRYIAKV